MGVLYIVQPLDDELREWIEGEGGTLPSGASAKQKSRNPTPAEIRKVCDALEGCKGTYNASAKGKFWQANVEGVGRANRDRCTLLNIDPWGGSETRRYQIDFEKGDPALILEIVQGLSAHCGPLAVIPDTGDVPAVLWPEADLNKLLKAWR